MRPETPPVLLRVPEFAARVALSWATVYEWIADRRLTVVRLGRVVRIPESEVARLIHSGTVHRQLEDRPLAAAHARLRAVNRPRRPPTLPAGPSVRSSCQRGQLPNR
jgi:excisionase family DNA binding protein